MTTQNNQQWHNFALRMDTISLRQCYRLAKDLENGCESESDKAKQLITELNKQSQNIYELCIAVADELNQPLASLLPQQATFNINDQLISILQVIRDGTQQLERYTSLSYELSKQSTELQKEFNHLYDKKARLDEQLTEHKENSVKEVARQQQQVQAAVFQNQMLDKELQKRIADARAFNSQQLKIYNDNIQRLSTLFSTEKAKNDELTAQLNTTNEKINTNANKIDSIIEQIKNVRTSSERDQENARQRISDVDKNIEAAQKSENDPNAAYRLDEKTQQEVNKRVQEEISVRKQQLATLNKGINEYIERTNGIRSEIYAAERLKERLLEESKKLSKQHALQQDQNVIDKIHAQQVMKNKFLKQTLQNLQADAQTPRVTKSAPRYSTVRKNW